MKLKNTALLFYQSALGILIEIAYSFAIIAASFGVICLVLLFK